MQPANVDLRDPNPDVPDNDWHKTFCDITARYAEGEGSIRRGFGIAPTIALLLDSAFPALETIAVIERRPMTTDQLLDRAFSRSTTSRERLGDRAAALAAEISDAMTALFPNGRFTEVVATQALIAKRARVEV